MPQKARISPPASFFHILARGIEGLDIFTSDNDREKFLQILSTGLKRTGYACYAWALMKNHYHLVLRSGRIHLSELIRGLNAANAYYFSRTHNRRGYLFQDRYKSMVTQDQGYVEELLRYVHANTLRAGVCKSLKELASYPWTGRAIGCLGFRSLWLRTNCTALIHRYRLQSGKGRNWRKRKSTLIYK